MPFYLQVNHNGHLTFETPWRRYIPLQFPMDQSRDIIAPYWTDLDNSRSGNIYYDQYTDGSILQQVTQDINSYFPEINFNASWIFIATWHKVPYFSMPETQSTFQVVLASNGNYSFVLLNYGALAPRETSIEVRELQSLSNNTIFSKPLYTIGGTASSRELDGSSPRISLPQTFNYFGKSYSQIYVWSPSFLDFKPLFFLIVKTILKHSSKS
uniref:NIDO domain-containing protein n=1 Tax=Cyprinodon variegatus TaxID=28743 RepID=A0A3Q2CE57_CYPVA